MVGGKVEQMGEEEAAGGVVTISGEWFINPGFWLINRHNIIGRCGRGESGNFYWVVNKDGWELKR